MTVDEEQLKLLEKILFDYIPTKEDKIKKAFREWANTGHGEYTCKANVRLHEGEELVPLNIKITFENREKN